MVEDLGERGAWVAARAGKSWITVALGVGRRLRLKSVIQVQRQPLGLVQGHTAYTLVVNRPSISH